MEIDVSQLQEQAQAWSDSAQRRFSPRQMAERTPRLYIATLNLVATLGYCFVFGLPLLTLLIGGYAAVLILEEHATWSSPAIIATASLTLFLVWTCIDLWRLKAERPAGVEITRRDAPELFDMLARRSSKFGAGEIHHVLLTRDAHIRVIRTPTNGFLLRHDNTLCLGVPLLHMLTRNQFRVALRCAIGQFAQHKDPNLGEMVSLRDNWNRYHHVLRQRKSPGSWLLQAFVAWYNPFFQQLSVEAAKQHALKYDQYAIEVIKDIEVLAMIAAEEVTEAYLNQCFWPMLMKTADRQPNPTVRPFSNFEPILQSSLLKQDAEHWLVKSITAPEQDQSPTPSLKERLDALGYSQLHFFSLPEDSAIHYLLGRKMNTVLKKMDQEWRTEINDSWRQRHLQFRNEKERFEKLHNQFHTDTLEGEAAFKYARLAKKYLPRQEALEVYTRLAERNKTHADVVFQMGALLLEAGEIQGLKIIEQAISLDKSHAPRASAIISEYMARRKGAVPKQGAEARPTHTNTRVHVA